MSVRVERKIVLVDDSDETTLEVSWNQAQERFEVAVGGGGGDIYTTPGDLLAFAKLLTETYGEHDPF